MAHANRRTSEKYARLRAEEYAQSEVGWADAVIVAVYRRTATSLLVLMESSRAGARWAMRVTEGSVTKDDLSEEEFVAMGGRVPA